MMLPPLLAQQVLMRDHMLACESAAIFAEPGLGKTRATLDALEILFSNLAIKGALIISPKRVSTMTWPTEIRRWSRLTFADLRTPEGIEVWNKGTADIYLINIEQVPQLIAKCFKGRRSVPVDLIVIDEISKFRAHDSVRAKSLFEYRKFFRRFIGLTGTPAPNSALDVFNQIKLLDGGDRLGKSFGAFRQKFAHTTDYLGYTWALDEGAEEKIQTLISDISISLTAEEFLDIPPVTEEDLEIDFPADVKAQYRKLEKDSLLRIDDKELVGETAAALVGKLQQFCAGSVYSVEDERKIVVPVHTLKTDALKKLHESIGKEPMLVFYHYQHDLTRIKAAIPWAESFDENRIEDWDAGKIPMWLAHPQATGHGLNLQKSCSSVCWYTPTWSNENYLQGNKRIARTGQTKPTTIYRILIKDSIDEAIVEAVKIKQEGQSGLMQALRNLRLLADAR